MAKFKVIADRHQIDFKEKFITKDSGFFINYGKEIPSQHFLPENDWKNGLNYVELYRDEIKVELKGFNNKMRDANMLRSEHIPLNIFVPMRNDLILTKYLFNKLLGNEIIETITGINIEIAGGKTKADYNKTKYLDDGTSFDTRIDFIHKDGEKGYLGIEVKYTEKSYKIGEKEKDDIFNDKNEHYFNITKSSGYYKESDIIVLIKDKLANDELRQIWRNHILGASMVHRTKEINHFIHIHLYPEGNEHFQYINFENQFQGAIPEYQKLLSENGKASFIPITYENLFCEMEQIFCENAKQLNWVNYLKTRYLF